MELVHFANHLQVPPRPPVNLILKNSYIIHFFRIIVVLLKGISDPHVKIILTPFKHLLSLWTWPRCDSSDWNN